MSFLDSLFLCNFCVFSPVFKKLQTPKLTRMIFVTIISLNSKGSFPVWASPGVLQNWQLEESLPAEGMTNKQTKLCPLSFIFSLVILFLFFTVVHVQFSAFPPYPSPPPQPSPPPSCAHPPLVMVPMSFIVVPVSPSPLSPIIPSPLPFGHCEPVLNFSVFGYTLLACSFC